MQRAKDRTVVLPYIFRVFPAVERELAFWRTKAAAIPDPELRVQAMASLDKKRFHCQGGSVYALMTPQKTPELIRFIVALQTISDYLDNLCDRVTCASDTSFRTLHLAMTAALDHQSGESHWYADYPHKEDGGYLDLLVRVSREAISSFAGYEDIRQDVLHLAALYSDLQVYKHMAPRQRVEMLVRWFCRHADLAPGLYWWEFAAASGSTLGIFALAATAAAGPVTRAEAERLLSGYFPWLGGLHILLDYFIDLDEDQEHGDLNFVACYTGEKTMQEGLHNFLSRSLEQAGHLPRPAFHCAVVKGLLAIYLSDPKALQGGRMKISQRLLRYGGPETVWMQKVCTVLRGKGII
jgi:tetraprenyl-beta-curcumene synthase